MKKTSRKERILNFFANNPGTHRTSAIAEALDLSGSSLSNVLGELTTEGRITKLKGGTYSGNDKGVSIDPQMSNADTSLKRTEADNEVTINKALSLFDKVLDDAAETIEGELYTKATMADKIDLIKSLRWLGATLDQLMKRWNLEHNGYDTNTRQAQEDAKAKTEAREKQALENAPIEERITVVGHYQEGMQEILRNLPRKDLEDSKV